MDPHKRWCHFAHRTQSRGAQAVHALYGMWLVGGCLQAGRWLPTGWSVVAYNFPRAHRNLCERLAEERTPAMAAGITDHRWSMEELLSFAVPPAELPKRRSRKPQWLHARPPAA